MIKKDTHAQMEVLPTGFIVSERGHGYSDSTNRNVYITEAEALQDWLNIILGTVDKAEDKDELSF